MATANTEPRDRSGFGQGYSRDCGRCGDFHDVNGPCTPNRHTTPQEDTTMTHTGSVQAVIEQFPNPHGLRTAARLMYREHGLITIGITRHGRGRASLHMVTWQKGVAQGLSARWLDRMAEKVA